MLAVERFIVVWFPFRARTLCTYRTSLGVTCCIPLVTSLLYSYQLAMWTVDEEYNCNFHPKYLYMMQYVHPWLTATLYSYAPTAILIVCTTGISVQLSRMRKKRQEMTTTQSRDADAEARITVMVITICVLFLVLTVPLTIFYIILFTAGGHIYQGPVMVLVESLIIILALTNHAINFFLYVASSATFRKELMQLCGRKKYRDTINSKTSGGRAELSVTALSSVSSAVANKEISDNNIWVVLPPKFPIIEKEPKLILTLMMCETRQGFIF